MSPQLLHQRIKKAQLDLRQNAVLDEAEDAKEYKRFMKYLSKSFDKQIDTLTDDQFFIDQLISLSTKAEVNNLIVTWLAKKWTDLKTTYNSFFESGKDEFTEFFLWAGLVGGQAAMDKLSIEIQFNLENEDVTAYLQNRANMIIFSVDNTTKEKIAQVIEDGRSRNLTNYEIGQEINKKVKSLGPVRSEMIAQTELANAVNAVEYEAYKRNGVKELRWVTVLDERVCPTCEPLHNQVVGMEGNFSSVDYDKQLLFSGERPPAHPRCRCFIEAVMDDFMVDWNNKIVWSGQ